MSLKHAREVIGEWREGYNSVRSPHSSLGALKRKNFWFSKRNFAKNKGLVDPGHVRLK